MTLINCKKDALIRENHSGQIAIGIVSYTYLKQPYRREEYCALISITIASAPTQRSSVVKYKWVDTSIYINMSSYTGLGTKYLKKAKEHVHSTVGIKNSPKK